MHSQATSNQFNAKFLLFLSTVTQKTGTQRQWMSVARGIDRGMNKYLSST